MGKEKQNDRDATSMNNNRQANTTRISASGSFPGNVPMSLCETD
ncbi:unnamed protein product [Coffea canephora]|uniref:Uncharacterized protein n=1 Tax=Coffea canephora TaxID=49390 RepID=A0A068TNV8_COFCA|nr:unnamed protein product [Coffea canephora]